MSRILPLKFQGACLWFVSLNNNQIRAPSREGGENRGRIETLTAGDWAYAIVGSRDVDDKTRAEIQALFNRTFCLPENIDQLRLELEDFYL